MIARTIRSLLLAGVTERPARTPTEIAEASGLFSQVLANDAGALAGRGCLRTGGPPAEGGQRAMGFIPLAQKTIDEPREVRSPPSSTPSTSTGTRAGTASGPGSRTSWSTADDLNAAADRMQMWFIVLAAVAVGVAVLVTWLVSRSIRGRCGR